MAAIAPAGANVLRTASGSTAAPVAQSARTVDGIEPADATAATGLERGGGSQLLGKADEPARYLIRLVEPAVPSYQGGEPGLAPTQPAGGGQLDPQSGPARAYRAHLEAAQAELVERMERVAGRAIDIPFTYQYAVNGIAAVLTADEARAVAADPAVASVALDQERELHTDSGPRWENADALWNAMAELGLPTNIKGEGIVIGTIDTGISPGNSSFADVGSDGYDHTNPLGAGNYLGACDESNAEQFDPAFPCNDKLIGAYVFGDANDSALDYDGHGSHTASTSGGNVVDDVVVEAPTLTTPPFDISGVAPHANVISYLGCCTLAGLTESIDQAIVDGVDVINYSIGSSSPSNVWDDFDTIGFLNARAAGIFVATSNGNDGPLPATTGSPADAPWLTSVGASTHNRHNGNAVTGLTSSAGSLPDILGKSVTGSLSSTAIVDAAAEGDEFCEDTTGHEAAFGGNIVICVRGVNGRVEKSQNIAGQGAAGFILINDSLHGDSLLGDEYAVPGVFISFDDGQTLLTWMASGTGHTGAIAGTTFTIDDARGDIMASFSSRGPNRAIDTIVPAVTAPGVDILAALGIGSATSDIHGFISGTSMSSPHVAGAGALLTQARPDWTPAQQQSALMTTARPTVTNHDGEPATPYAQGSGHVDVGAATLAGLLFDEQLADYLAANPAEGGDPKSLNLPSFADSQCLDTCSWTRDAQVPDDADAPVPSGVTWTATTTSDSGLTLAVDLTPATVSPGDSMAIAVTADVGGAEAGETLFGRITLTPSNPAVPTVTMPVAVVPSAGVLPGEVEFETRRNAGSQLVRDIEAIEITEFTGSVNGLVRAKVTAGELSQDPTRDDPYDDLDQVDVHNIRVPVGGSRLVAEVLETEMPDLDLFVGTGTTPSADTVVCISATGGSAEKCDIPDPQSGNWWILVQNWEGTDSQPDTYSLATGAVGPSRGNASLVGPSGPIPAGEPFDVRVVWNLPQAQPGDIWYGVAVLGTSPGTPGDIGSFPVTLHRVEDDVTKEASVSEATPGDEIDYTITVQPNVTDTDLVYRIVDTVPDGLTIDPDSVTGGGVVDGQRITWQVPMPTAVGLTGNYVVSTPGTSAQCAAWAGFLDLEGLIPLSEMDGDTVAVNAFSSIGPFELYGEQFANLVVAEDGFITVPGGYGGFPWEPQSIPDAALPNGVMAPLWSDLELSVADARGVILAVDTGNGAAIAQWEEAFEFTPDDSTGPSVGKFQAWIYNSVSDVRPEMTFEYGELGDLPGFATIGVESFAGDLATAIVAGDDPAPSLTEGGSYCLDYEGPSFDPAVLTYTTTVDVDAEPGVVRNRASHTTNDPYARRVIESVPVQILDQCTRTLTGNQRGHLTVTSGTTCLDSASVQRNVTVSEGASLIAVDSIVNGTLTASDGALVRLCNSDLVGAVSLTGGDAVYLGDPATGCDGNRFYSHVTVQTTAGPSIIAGNVVTGNLACTGNTPAPTNNGLTNVVGGTRSGQCVGL